MHERMRDNSLPLPEWSHETKVRHDAETILAEVNKTSLKFEVQTPVHKPRQVNPQLFAAFASYGSSMAEAKRWKEITKE